MRLEQLVLFGPEDDFRVPFGPQVTVLAGMGPEDRAQLVATLVDALAGRLQGASVVYVDHAGRKIFADRDGATYAADGSPAPALSSMLGCDPGTVAKQVMLRAADLGLGEASTLDAVEAELADAERTAAQLGEACEQARTLVVQVEQWKTEMAQLDALIERSHEDAERWAWIQLRNELDGVRAELAAYDHESDEHDDSRLLDAVDRLRQVGETWAEAGAAVSELDARLVPLPGVTEDDLARVASTPNALPPGFEERADTWQFALTHLNEREAVLEAATTPPAPHEDPMVERLARLDQKELWVTHHRLMVARSAYAAELIEMKDDVDPSLEADIEAAHVEVLRCQRNVKRRFLAGTLGSAILSVGALLAGHQLSVVVGMAMLLAAIGMGTWLLAVPRRELRLAQRDEEMALRGAEADSWLGLHLRRVDDLTERADRRRLDAATDVHATAQLDWEEFSGRADPDLAAERRADIEAHAIHTSPERRAEAERHARTDVTFAREDEAQARAELAEGLEAYGLTPDGLVGLDADRLIELLERRIGAGRLARDTQDLRIQQKRAAIAAADLDHLLQDLGFDDGDLTSRLDRAIEAVSMARARSLGGDGRRPREEVEAELTALAALVEAGRRASWDATADPTEAPVDPETLVAQRGELSQRIAAAGAPNVDDLERRLTITQERVAEVRARRDETAAGDRPLLQRIADRVARTTWLGDHEDSLPVLVDEPFTDLSEDERREVLDLLARLSVRTQIVVLTADPVAARWARAKAATAEVTLLEAEHATV